MCSVETTTLWQEEMQDCVFISYGEPFLFFIFGGPWTIAGSVISLQQT